MTNRPENTITTLTICYETNHGGVSQRGVSVTEFDPRQMSGLCHLRDRNRTFLYERVISCVDVKTGKVISDIHQHLLATYRSTPLYSLDLLKKNHYECLQTLLYVGKADGQLRAAERMVILATCKVLTRDVRITEGQVNELLDSIPVPSLHSFKVAIGRIQKRGNADTMRKMLMASRTIIATQASITATETEALNYMTKRFGLSS